MQGREPTFGDGRYLIRRELGRGTMGVVYEAEDSVLGRTVALKTIAVTFVGAEAAGRAFERRFFTEARVAAQLSHPGIVVCHDVGKDPASGQLFIVFERLRGRTLADRAAEGPMAWRQAAEVVVQVARAIHHAHEHGVVHRDLKPANIMLLDPEAGGAAAHAEANVKIMDFGVARLEGLGQRLTGTGQSFGSPLYASPEQALGHASTARSDIFSLGSVLCTLLLGRPWFDAPSLPEIVARVVHDDPPRLSALSPDLPASLDRIVAVALAKRAEDRYAAAARMADDLEDVVAGRPPRHAARASGRGSAEDALLAGLAVPAGARRGLPTQDPLASLLDEAPAPVVRPLEATTPLGSPPPVSSGPARRRVVPAVAVLVLGVLAAGVFVTWRRSSPPDLTGRPSPAPGSDHASAAVVPAASLPPPAPTSTVPVEPETAVATAPTTVATPPATPPPTPAPATVPVVRPAVPVTRPAVPTTVTAPPVVESPAVEIPDAGEPAAEPSPATAPASRMRLSVEHPFENARLVVWLDGVLVYETKLQASGSRRIVGFKVPQGRAQKMLDVEPGPHEVRVEVTWAEDRRVGRKVIDVASGATGLLEVRVGSVSKDLNLAWSRLAKD